MISDSKGCRSRRMPAEWESCEGILLALPHSASDWAPILQDAIDQYRRLIKAFVEAGEKCVVLANDAAQARIDLEGIPMEHVTIVEMPINDTWTRDYGPIAAMRDERLRAIDFGFNGWGLKFPAFNDNLVNLRMRERFMVMPDTYRNCRSFILEGGSIDTDGQGTLLTTSHCLLSPNRNGSMSKSEIAGVLESELGAEHILWLDYGALEGDDTDSHIDTLCRMAPGNCILFTGCRDMDDPHFEDLLKMRAQLTAFRNMQGEPFNLIELPLPAPQYDEDGSRLPATYANYLVTERNLFMPVYSMPLSAKDILAINTVKIAFPEHQVIPVDCRVLLRQHGSLHCSTMQLPANLLNSTVYEH